MVSGLATDLDFETVRAGVEDGSILVGAVREDYELLGGMIPGSASMPLSRFDPASLPTGPGRIVFSCAAGVRSRVAIGFCQAAGLPLAEHFVGGFKGWLAAGGPIEPGP